MKKLDLHIHTLQTVSDYAFAFSIEKMKEYIQTLQIDGIAITNHNAFDLNQYRVISQELSGICAVLPGIEINIGLSGTQGFGHLICITDPNDVDDFATRCQSINAKIVTRNDKITLEELGTIFDDFGKYLWIPHYDKKPIVDSAILLSMREHIVCGETGSVKKFIYRQKDNESLTPVLFSDLRPTDDLAVFPLRQTFFDIDDISVGSIKASLIEKGHVSLTEEEGKNQFYVLPDLPISTGLNIIIGERSSGKTHTLNEIKKHHENIKYIKQFSLVETDPERSAKQFTDKIAEKRSSFAEEYFALFKDAIEIAKGVSQVDDEKDLEQYLTALVRFAKETDRADMFAKCALYGESKFPSRSLDNIKGLIAAVEKLLDAREYKDIIERHLPRESMIALYEELIHRHNQEKKRSLEESWVNDLVSTIKQTLRSHSAATDVQDVDFYRIQMNRFKIHKFNELAFRVMRAQVINQQEMEGFVIQARKRPFASASELKTISGRRDVTFSSKMEEYKTNPYKYLIGLCEMAGIPESDYYKYFAYLDYQILNQYGFPVSGGERAEFNLLQEINDAYRYDILLIDEPESSFDNLFLRDRVNHILREISKTMPVILVTHNNTVGASIKPDYIVHTKRIIGEDVYYERYFGLPSSKELSSPSGERISNIQVLMDCLEAGEETYNERKHDYDLLKN